MPVFLQYRGKKEVANVLSGDSQSGGPSDARIDAPRCKQ